MRFDTLNDWLDWQSTLHPTAMDLGLDRVRAVAARLRPRPPATAVITVGGTNGKGSCVRYLEEMLGSAGYRTAAYTSPHLVRYNERVRIAGREVDDEALCAAFERVDRARGDISLTYFEFGTLAALDIFWCAAPDVAILEVGLGGRLDAVNVVEPDCAVVTNVALDHLEWLGPDRESIGREKAGIFRAGVPAICADRDPPASLLEHAAAIGAQLKLAGRDFDWRETGATWMFDNGANSRAELPRPAMAGAWQLANAAAALAVLDAVAARLPVERAAIQAGLKAARVPGRFEIYPGDVTTILDVGHNPAAAGVLAAQLSAPFAGRTFAVCGMLRDKAAAEVAALLAPQVDHWFLADLDGPRSLDGATLRARLTDIVDAAAITLGGTPAAAWRAAQAAAQPGDRVVVFGSFLTVGAVRGALAPQPAPRASAR